MEKILVVEDELIVARDIKKTLERNGIPGDRRRQVNG